MIAINSNHSFLAFRHEIENSRAWLQSKVFGACGYSSEVLLDRLLQRLVEIALQPYAAAVMALCKTKPYCFPASDSSIECSRASFVTGTGRIAIALRQLLANHLDFVLHWAFCLGMIFLPARAAMARTPAILVFGVGAESLFVDERDDRFVRFCRLGPIGPLRHGKRFFVQSPTKKLVSVHAEFIYCDRPLIGVLRETQIGLLGRLQLAANHLILFFQYLIATLRLPALSLLGRDFAYSAVSFDLDRRGLLEAIVFTSSNYNSQPLWARGLQHSTTHLIWYAQNLKPIVFVADGVESEVPSARWIRVDTHWVWTRAFASYLRELGHQATIEVVGPIVWYLPELKSRPTASVEIAIFDVPPLSDAIALTAGGWVTNYWCPNNVLSFIHDIISIKPSLEEALRLPVILRLKTKRGYVVGYDNGYFSHISELEQDGGLFLEHHSSNMYSMISGSHLVVAFPFTSPAYIAEALGVPAIYYDPTNSIVGHHFGDSPALIDFASSPDELLNSMLVALRGGPRPIPSPKSLLPAG